MKNGGAIVEYVLAKLIGGASEKVLVNGDSVAFMNERRFRLAHENGNPQAFISGRLMIRHPTKPR